MSSNTTPATDLSFGSNLGGVNYSPTGHADVKYTTIKANGTLTVASNADTPDTNIVTVGAYGTLTENVVFLKLDFTAAREDIDIRTIELDRLWGTVAYDDAFSAVSLWDGATQLSSDRKWENKGYDHSSTTFAFTSAEYWRIPKGETKTLTVKADLRGVKTTDNIGTLTGQTPKICLITGEGSDYAWNGNLKVDAIGKDSGVTIHAASSTDICGNEQIFHQSKPTIAAASLPDSVLGVKTATLFRWTVTADDKGAIGWKKVIFDVSGTIQVGTDYCSVGKGGTTSTNGIYMGTSSDVQTNVVTQALVATSSMHVYNVGTGVEINPTTTDSGFFVWNYTDGGARVGFVAKNEQIVPAGTTKTYDLKGDIKYSGKAGDSLSFKIEKRSTATCTDSFNTSTDPTLLTSTTDTGAAWTLGDSWMNVTSTAPTFVWTDRSGAGSTHSLGTEDWTIDYKVPGLPTATLSLSR